MSDYPYIIGITGKAGAGKDTFAEYLRTAFNKRSIDTVIAWHATPIKKMLDALYEYIGEESDWDDRAWKELAEIMGITPRTAAQTLGTEWGREIFGPDIWSKIFLRVAKNAKRFWGRDVVICPDVRFDNECRNIDLVGGVIVKIHRGEQDANFRGGDHSSEAGVSSGYITYHVENEASLEELRNQAEALAKHLEGKVCRQTTSYTS